MKKVIKLLTIATSLLLATGFTVSEGVNAIQKRSVTVLQEQYDLYDSVSIPSYTFTEGNSTQTVNGVVIMPDGSSTNSNRIDANQIGRYKVIYSANLDGVKKYEEKYFVVKTPLFQISNPKSSSIVTKTPAYAKAYTSAEGAYVTLAKGDTLKVNQLIDFTDTTKADKVLSGFVTPTVQTEVDMSNLTFVLTDFENPDIYMTIILNNQSDVKTSMEYSYWRAGGQNQTLTGYYTNPNYDKTAMQTTGRIGTLTKVPFNAAHNNGRLTFVGVDPSTEPFYFAYDSTENALFTSVHIENRAGQPQPSIELQQKADRCADFDDPAYFKTNLWNGFPSGKAYLSIYASRYSKSDARFCLTHVKDCNLTDKYVEDNVGPKVTIHKTFEVMPNGQVGMPYAIPSATAFDVEEQKSKAVQTTVCYNYGTDQQIDVSVENNTFTPTKNGLYHIVYVTEDIFGNQTEEALPIYVGPSYDPIDFTIPSFPNSILAGNSFDIGEATGITGGVGCYTPKVTVTDSLGTQEVELGKYWPRVIGENKINFTVYDYVGNKVTKTATVNVTNNANPVVKEYIDLEDTYLTEYDSKFPQCIVNVVEGDNIVEKVCDLDVEDARSGATSYLSTSETFSVVGNHALTKATFKFKYNNNLVESKEVNLIEAYIQNSEDINLASYFVGSGFSTEFFESSAVGGIKISNTAEQSNWRFYNPVTARNASLTLKKLTSSTPFGFSYLEICVADTKNSNQTLTFKFYSTYFTIGGDSTQYTFSASTSDEVLLSLSENLAYINNVQFNIKKFDNGTVFTNFDSEKAYLSVKAVGSNSQYCVTKINNFLTMNLYDDVIPSYAISGQYGGSYKCGSDYTFYPMTVADVVKPYSKAYLTVKFNNRVVSDKNGTALNQVDASKQYELKLSQIGSYSVSYTFEGETKKFNFAIRSLDSQAPVISFLSEVPTTVKQGSTIKVPKFEITDDATSTENLTVIVSFVIPSGYEQYMQYTKVNSDDKKELVTLADSIVAIYKGTYKLKIIAYDEGGNSSVKIIDILVK